MNSQHEDAKISGFIGLYTLEKLPSATVPIQKYLEGDQNEFIKTLLRRNPRLFKEGMFAIRKSLTDVISRLNGATQYPHQAYIIRLRFTPEKTVQLASEGRFHETLYDAYEFNIIDELLQSKGLKAENLTAIHHVAEQHALKPAANSPTTLLESTTI